MIGHHFIVSDSTDGRIAGHALICPDARYASIRWRGADRMDRRFIRGQAWAPVIAETVARDWPEGQVDLQSELGRLIVPEDRRAVLTVRHASDPQFPADCVLGELDAYLHAQSFP